MNNETLQKKYGMIFILDALGASMYSDEKILKFLNARKDLDKIISDSADMFRAGEEGNKLSTYTFGDTLIVVVPIDDRADTEKVILYSSFMMQNYLFGSMKKGILYRGAFSIGSYIADEGSNTVMGEAVSDAAAWYEKAEWMGLTCTPKTNNIIEHAYPKGFNNPLFYSYYPVPMKESRTIDLYTISWAGRFFQDAEKIPQPREKFIELLLDHPIPLGTEEKIKNTKDYFSYIEEQINLTNHST